MIDRLAEKDTSDKKFFEEGVQILNHLGLFETNESAQNIVWQGPDYFNLLGISTEDISLLQKSGEPINEYFNQIYSNFSNEIFNREMLYYKQLLGSEVSEAEFGQIIQSSTKAEEHYTKSNISLEELQPSKPYGYALLKGKKRKFFIQKLATVIGRTGVIKNFVSWQVDIDLRNNPKISKQHALILYNFEEERFEIKCLSSKHSIRVNGSKYTLKDEPVALEHQSLISIGTEQFYFILPKV